MAGALTIRELITRYSFKTDDKPIKTIDNAVAGLKSRVGALDAKIKQAFVSIAKWTVAGAAAASVAIVKMASDAEESESKFDAVFKAQKDDVRAWSDEIAGAMGRSGFKLREFAAGLQDTFVPLGFARGTAAQLSQNLTELALDVASFQNKAEPEVIEAFTSAIVGNHEAVRSFGITLTQSRLDAKIKELKQTMPGFTKVAVEQQKALARYQIIIDSTSDAQGDAIRTSGGFANQMRGLRARFERVAITLGQKLLPLATEWVNKLSTWIDANEELITQKVGKVLDGMISAFKVLAQVVRFVINHWSTLVSVVGGLIAARVVFGIGRLSAQLANMAGALSKATAGAKGASGALSKVAGGTSKVAGVLGKLQAVGLALGVGWTIGTLLNDWLGISDKLVKKLMDAQKLAAKERVKGHERATSAQRLIDTAKRLGQLRARGVESVEAGPGGKRIGLTQEGIQQLIQQQAQRLGVSGKIQESLMPQLLRIAAIQAPAAAPAGGPQSTSNFQVTAPQITVNVPAGTQPTQAKRVADAAGAATTSAMRRAIGDVAR